MNAILATKSKGCYSNLFICIWRFPKWYWLLCYDVEFRRYIFLGWMNFVKFLLSQHFFDIPFLQISWTVPQTPIKGTIFWKSMMWSFRWNEHFVLLDSRNIHIKESKRTGVTFSIELRAKIVWSHGLTINGFWKIIQNRNVQSSGSSHQTSEGLATRSKSQPYLKEPCLMSKGLGSSVSNVEFEATGKHMLEVSKKLQDKGLFKWLNEITKAEDTAVNHAVYRNRCWTNGRSEVRPRQKKKMIESAIFYQKSKLLFNIVKHCSSPMKRSWSALLFRA